jgi:hypothetical protein
MREVFLNISLPPIALPYFLLLIVKSHQDTHLTTPAPFRLVCYLLSHLSSSASLVEVGGIGIHTVWNVRHRLNTAIQYIYI